MSAAPPTTGLPEISYLAWALPRYHRVRFDLASSGLEALPVSALGAPDRVFAGATDPSAPARWVDAIARRFDVPSDCVSPALGTTHALWCAYAALLGPGVDVVVESPVYEPLVRLAEGQRARVIPFVRDVDRGAPIDPDAVGRAIGPRTKLVVVSNLHNPTGARADDAAIVEVARLAARVGAHVLVDEVYRDLVDFDPSRGRTAFGLAPNVIVTSSLTKVYGLPWLRAGWVLAPEPVTRRVRGAVLHSAGAISWALAAASIEALARIDELHAASLRARAHDDVAAERLAAWVAGRPHLAWRRAPSSMFGFVVDRRGLDLRPLIERAIDEEQVIVAPGSFFGWPAGFRVRYGATSLEVVDEGLRRLGRVLDAG